MSQYVDFTVRLRNLADQMETLGADMDYYGGMAPWSPHGRELIGAAQIARQWAEEIENETANHA